MAGMIIADRMAPISGLAALGSFQILVGPLGPIFTGTQVVEARVRSVLVVMHSPELRSLFRCRQSVQIS